MTIPNDWHDATYPTQWRLNEEYETAGIEFTTAHGRIWWNGSLKSEKSVEYSGNQLKKCGWNGDWESRDLVAKPVRIKVGPNEKSGKQEVQAISDGTAAAPKDPVKARSLINRLKGGGAAPADPFAAAPAPEWDGQGDDPSGGDTTFP
jgi:hypothetical protein